MRGDSHRLGRLAREHGLFAELAEERGRRAAARGDFRSAYHLRRAAIAANRRAIRVYRQNIGWLRALPRKRLAAQSPMGNPRRPVHPPVRRRRATALRRSGIPPPRLRSGVRR